MLKMMEKNILTIFALIVKMQTPLQHLHGQCTGKIKETFHESMATVQRTMYRLSTKVTANPF